MLMAVVIASQKKNTKQSFPNLSYLCNREGANYRIRMDSGCSFGCKHIRLPGDNAPALSSFYSGTRRGTGMGFKTLNPEGSKGLRIIFLGQTAVGYLIYLH